MAIAIVASAVVWPYPLRAQVSATLEAKIELMPPVAGNHPQGTPESPEDEAGTVGGTALPASSSAKSHAAAAKRTMSWLEYRTLEKHKSWQLEIAAVERDNNVAERIHDIQMIMNADAPAATRWWNGWMTFYTLSITVQGVLAPLADGYDDSKFMNMSGQRSTNAINSFASNLGFWSTLLLPFPGHNGHKKLRAFPGRTPYERERKLAFAESMLEGQAKAEGHIQSLVSHLGGVVVPAGFASLMYFHYGQKASAYQHFFGGIVVNEFRIAIAPRVALDAWDKYNNLHVRFRPGDLARATTPESRLQWSLVPTPSSLHLVGSF
ncbi:MAG: hypothetical protein HRU17_06790 [Polyangiaceae bacterium]|nr:hypothetical protein [Polyangiaceae bacterium]